MPKTFSKLIADDLKTYGLYRFATRFSFRFGTCPPQDVAVFYHRQRSRVWAGRITQDSAIRSIYRFLNK